jgi:hypothetical protein
VAGLMLALTLIPAEVWHAPQTDRTYSGFDRNLIYTSSDGGASVRVSTAAIDLNAPAQSTAGVILATTPLQKLRTSVDVTLEQNQNAVTPFRLGLWSPWTSAGFFVVFGTDGLLSAETLMRGNPDVTLQLGQVSRRTQLGSYRVGEPYRVEFMLDKAARVLTTRITGQDVGAVTATVDSRESPTLFANVALSLSGTVDAGTGSSRVQLDRFTLALPHERLWASQIDDPLVRALVAMLAVAGVVLGLIALARRPWRRPRFLARIRLAGMCARSIGLAAGTVAVYLVGNALLFPLGGHPFDMRAEQLYAYVARTYGISDLYYLPNVVSLAKLWNGIPFQEFPFPYGPLFAYLFAGDGWIKSAFNGFGLFTLDSARLAYLIKSVNVVFGLADGIVIYWILRQIGVTSRWRLVAVAFWIFNPAVWFSVSVWGQTHVISLFFALLVVLFIERHQLVGAWLSLTAACLTRPQMLVFGLLLGIVLLRKFPWRENLSALTWTVVVTFVAFLPLTLATSPSLPVDILLNTLRAHETGAPGAMTAVSQDAYSIWPMVEYLTQGATGFHSTFNPNNGVIAGPLNFQRLSQILTLLAVGLVATFLALRRRVTKEPGAYIPYVALGATAFLMLFFDVIATHFLLALPFLVLSRRWMGAVAYFYVVVIWTVTTFVTMYGDMALVLTAADYPLLASANNAVTRFVIWLYTGDRFITAGIVANVCAVVWLGYLILRPAKSQETATETVAVLS